MENCIFCKNTGRIELAFSFVDCECDHAKFDYDNYRLSNHINSEVLTYSICGFSLDEDKLQGAIFRSSNYDADRPIYFTLMLEETGTNRGLGFTLGSCYKKSYAKERNLIEDKCFRNYYKTNMTLEKFRKIYLDLTGEKYWSDASNEIYSDSCKWCKGSKVLKMLTSTVSCTEC